jgi:hypothetical protein
MQINLKKAYNYYLTNLDKSCETRVLDRPSFERGFLYFLEILRREDIFFDFEDVPVLTKCNKSKFLHINRVLIKIK